MSDKKINIEVSGDSSSAVAAAEGMIDATKKIATTGEQSSKAIVDGEKKIQNATVKSKEVREKTAKASNESIDTLVKSIDKLQKKTQSNFFTIFNGLSAFSVVRRFFDYAQKALIEMTKSLDVLGKTAGNLGVTTAYMQKLDFAARHTNTDISSVVTGFERIKNAAAKAAAGDKSAVKLFHDMSISISEIRDMSPEQLFDRVSRSLSSMTGALERDRLSSELFGKSFSKLNNFLTDYQLLGDQLQSNGGIISEDDINAAAQISDAWTDIKQSITAIVANMHILTMLAKNLRDVSEGLSGLLSNARKVDKTNAEDYYKDKKPEDFGDVWATYANSGPLQYATWKWLHKTFGSGGIKTAPATQEEMDEAIRKRQERLARDKEIEEAPARIKKEQEAAADMALQEEMLERRKNAIMSGTPDMIANAYLSGNQLFRARMKTIGTNVYHKTYGKAPDSMLSADLERLGMNYFEKNYTPLQAQLVQHRQNMAKPVNQVNFSQLTRAVDRLGRHTYVVRER